VPFLTEWVDRPIFDRFAHIVAQYGQKIAVDDGVLRFSYDQLFRASLHLAQRIDASVPPGRPVGVLLPNGSLFSIAALACLAVGRPIVPIDSNYPPARQEQIIRDSGLKGLILHPELAKDEGNTIEGILPIDITISMQATPNCNVVVSAPGGPALILYTSGSTGRPKAVCNDQRAVSFRVAQFTNACHLHSDDRVVLLSSGGTIAGFRDTFAALLNGATLHVADPRVLGIGGVLQVMARAERTSLLLPGRLPVLYDPFSCNFCSSRTGPGISRHT
jgi:non-ribosomal peptide synthetase component F